jgi:iron complex transport system ATP-binding protein
MTVVAVLHDLNLAAEFAPRVVVLSDGRVVADGPPLDVLTPELVREAFGVEVEAIGIGEGRRHLALRLS